MKVRIYTDVVLAPVVKEIRKITPAFDIKEYYEEDLISKLLNATPTELDEADIIFVHSDQLFHRKPAAWQNSYLSAFTTFCTKTTKKILLSNSVSLSFSTGQLTGSGGLAADVFSFYKKLQEEAYRFPNVYVLDFYNLCLQAGLKNIYQYSLGHLYQMPYNKQFSVLFAAHFTSQVKWLFSEEKKAIIVDCDNTLWKGVIGEDGLDGIACDKNADGILFYHFQLFLKAKKEEGFLLCICSKNNEADVKEAFEKKNMPLQWSDFVIKKVNWNDKWKNIQDAASELNINTDSFIFIDDNPFEINSVAELVKGITSFEFKNDYELFLKMTSDWVFRKKRILKEDLEKSKQYEVEFQRQEEQNQYENIDDFLKSLNIALDIRLNETTDFTRLAQMTGKTNQFNFNKKELSEIDLSKFIEAGNRIYSMRMSDKFGDYGIVGLILVEVKDSSAVIENFLMSCRALGKKAEDNFYKHVIDDVTKSNLEIESVKFINTVKNKPAQDFLNRIKDEYNFSRTEGNLSVSS